MCLAVTYHLHFWQTDRDLLRATAVTRVWTGYRNKSQHRKLTLEKKKLPSLLPGLEPTTFRSRARRSNYWAIPAPLSTSQTKMTHCGLRRASLTAPGPQHNLWPLRVLSTIFDRSGSSAQDGFVLYVGMKKAETLLTQLISFTKPVV